MLNPAITKEDLKEQFQIAKDEGYQHIGVSFYIEGFPKNEVIINSRENFDSKLEYYLNTYDDNLIHKFSKSEVRITDFTCGNSFDDIGMYFE